MSHLLDIVNEILDDAGRQKVEALESAMELRGDLGFDSLELAILTVKIEAHFGVDVFADGIVATIGEVQEKIQRRVGNPPEQASG